jgi:hypothetical protein
MHNRRIQLKNKLLLIEVICPDESCGKVQDMATWCKLYINAERKAYVPK